MLERLKSPWFILALSGLLYKVLDLYIPNFAVSDEDWKIIIDLIAYLFIGVGVYSSHQPKDGV